ncbi:MAG: SDR family NAD(P)-dependent oxidoreductase, partial [Actinomycetota bacterium]|nr:SDR family NAD(P)-dependent oxidoreductase [Actinomycetota bacterium]
MDHEEKTALVTGASTGLGFEAAAQLAEEGFGRVIVTARTPAKGGATVERLVARTGMDVFEAITLDNDVLSTVDTAADELAPMGGIDLLILNAGIAPPAKLRRTVDDLDAVVSSSLVGHHRLTVRLLERGQVNENARIVIAGSEAARGDVPMMHPADINDFAAEHFDGDLEAAIETQMRMTSPARYKGNDVYATTKLFAAWWAAELATRLPKGATVNAVSPGATPDT